jgi:hypothetical protein
VSRVTGPATLAGTASSLLLPVAAGRRWDGYSPRRHYISELGAHDAPDGIAVSAGFAAIGVSLLLGISDGDPGRSLVLGGLGSSYLVSSVARCDPGCPDAGTLSKRQQVHNLAGVVGYGVGIVGPASAARSAWRSGHRRAAAVAGAVAVGSATLATLTATRPASRGLYQRALEALLLGWTVSARVES